MSRRWLIELSVRTPKSKLRNGFTHNYLTTTEKHQTSPTIFKKTFEAKQKHHHRFIAQIIKIEQFFFLVGSKKQISLTQNKQRFSVFFIHYHSHKYSPCVYVCVRGIFFWCVFCFDFCMSVCVLSVFVSQFFFWSIKWLKKRNRIEIRWIHNLWFVWCQRNGHWTIQMNWLIIFSSAWESQKGISPLSFISIAHRVKTLMRFLFSLSLSLYRVRNEHNGHWQLSNCQFAICAAAAAAVTATICWLIFCCRSTVIYFRFECYDFCDNEFIDSLHSLQMMRLLFVSLSLSVVYPWASELVRKINGKWRMPKLWINVNQ